MSYRSTARVHQLASEQHAPSGSLCQCGHSENDYHFDPQSGRTTACSYPGCKECHAFKAEPPQAIRARARKATMLAAYLRVLKVPAARVGAFTEHEWALTAKAAGVEPPHSPATVSLVTTFLERRIIPRKVVLDVCELLVEPIGDGATSERVYVVRLLHGYWPDREDVLKACVHESKIKEGRFTPTVEGAAVVKVTLQ